MNTNEQLWDYENDSVAEFHVVGASRETVARAKDTLMETWRAIDRQYTDRRYRSFHDICQSVIENGGRNNFDA